MTMLHVRMLTQSLILSVSLNVILLSLCIYWFIRETPPTPYCAMKPAARQEQQVPLATELNNSEMIMQLSVLPLHDLIKELDNTQLVENGYTERDLTLGTLVTYHKFDIKRALKGLEFPKHRQLFGVTIYRDLSEVQWDAIKHFAKTEKWPLTTEGLFEHLQKDRTDPTLVDAFTLSEEFMTVEMLFNRSEHSVPKPILLQILLEGNWEMLQAFAEQQKSLQDLSSARRQTFLLKYIENKSQTAAYLFLKTDPVFVTQKLDDPHVSMMLSLLQEHTPESEAFALSILTSPRGDSVLQAAANVIYNYSGKLPPAKATQVKPKIVAKPQPKQKATKVHEVKSGDSLWKIARQHKTTTKAIADLNRMDEKAILSPGMRLKLPNR